MPTYDYLCENCGHAMELFQSITESAKKKCPHCGKLKLKRLLGTGVGVIFRGSGFYETDYRSDSYKKGAEKEASSTSAKTDKQESKTKTETKPETKSKTDFAASKKNK